MSALREPLERECGLPVLRVAGVSAGYGEKAVLRNVEFTLRR